MEQFFKSESCLIWQKKEELQDELSVSATSYFHVEDEYSESPHEKLRQKENDSDFHYFTV